MATNILSKVCPKCKENKLLEMFSRHKGKKVILGTALSFMLSNLDAIEELFSEDYSEAEMIKEYEINEIISQLKEE